MSKIALFATVAALVGYSTFSAAADAKWTAVATLERGTSQNCGGGQNDWQLEIQGSALKYVSGANRSGTIDLKSLQPDGSGKVSMKDDKNREYYLTFEPGTGPRVFHVTNAFNACGFLLTPKK